MTRIFIVDDHPMVIEGIRSMLLHLPKLEVVGHAMNAASCLGYFVNHSADVVLLDINLPDQSGIDVCQALLKRWPELKIIALTNLDQLTYLQSMKEAGAIGYLLKNSSLQEIEMAIGAATSGKEYWLGKDSIRESMQEHNRPLLTRREIEVLK
ncbi:MAG: response regulator transcription factor, partial [Cyclobacteriaceae bacterium]|nr:response regulator transcription factor [Cyclobacteriaceae bacterium]